MCYREGDEASASDWIGCADVTEVPLANGSAALTSEKGQGKEEERHKGLEKERAVSIG